MKRATQKLIDAYAAKAKSAVAVQAVKMVAEGATYGETAEALGISRNTVAGACHRAGLIAPVSLEKAKRISERNREKARQRWAKYGAEGNWSWPKPSA